MGRRFIFATRINGGWFSHTAATSTWNATLSLQPIFLRFSTALSEVDEYDGAETHYLPSWMGFLTNLEPKLWLHCLEMTADRMNQNYLKVHIFNDLSSPAKATSASFSLPRNSHVAERDYLFPAKPSAVDKARMLLACLLLCRDQDVLAYNVRINHLTSTISRSLALKRNKFPTQDRLAFKRAISEDKDFG